MKERIKITDSRVQEAIVLYKSGESKKTICKKLRMDGVTLNRFLDRTDNNLSTEDAVRRGKFKGKIYDDVLDILTPEALYWIGFIYADGHLASDRPRIVLGLSEVDKGHVEKFAKFFGEGIYVFESSKKGHICLGYESQAGWRAQFSSRRIYNRLCELGIKPNKTYDITVNEVLRYSRDFWRGVIDGDGHITKDYRYFTVGLSGHENTIRFFLDFVKYSGISSENVARKSKKSEHLWRCDVHSKESVKLLKLLYENSSIYLDRKYDKFLEIYNN